MNKMILFFIIFSIVLSSIGFAQDISVTYNDLEKYVVGTNLESSFTIKNNGDTTKEINIKREINPGEELISYTGWELKIMKIEYEIQYLEYTTSLEPDESKTLSVTTKYSIVPLTGKKIRPFITVFDKDTFEILAYTGPTFLDVKCVEDGICDNDIGENSRNCLSDCSTGGDDGFCDMVEDGISDPNCINKEKGVSKAETKLDPDNKLGGGIVMIDKPEVDSQKMEEVVSGTDEELISVINEKIYIDVGNEVTCIDSDDGDKPFTKGNMYIGGDEYIDSCDGNILNEYYCIGDYAEMVIHTCEYGCLDGACKESENFIIQIFDAITNFFVDIFGS